MRKDNYLCFVKFFLTLFTIILIPIYWYYYGVQNFLWLSDIGLFLTVIGLWFNSRLLLSMAAVGVLAVELAWNIDFFALIFNINLIYLAHYMFDSTYPIFLRVLSSFHIINPLVWIWYLAHSGYDKRAFYYFTVLYWIVLIVTYLFTHPKKNINWAFLPQVYAIPHISPLAWVIFLFICFPLLVFLPTHYVCKKIFKDVNQASSNQDNR